MIVRYLQVLALGLCISLLSIYSGAFGCAAPTADADASAAASFPETCAEAQEIAVDATGERPANGTYTLYIDGDESLPWDAYCYDMQRAEPKEYIDVEESDNYSQISNGSDIFETTYRRLRIDPIRLEIWPLDSTFADSSFDIADEGAPMLPEGMDHIPAGWAEYQVPSEEDLTPVAAEANVNLAGTAFIFNESVNDDGYFCSVSSSDEVEQMSEGTGATVAADLASFVLTAITTYPVFDSTIREVADCTNLGSTFDTSVAAEVDAAVWPLEYVGE